jgi:hypothetical protein
MKHLPIVEPAPPPPTRCTGHCCREMQIGQSLRTLHATALREAGDARPGLIPESVQVAAMLRPFVGPSTCLKGSDGEPRWITEADHRYSCVYVQPNGDCGNYEDRPRMCREYPYGHACSYEACTWDRYEAVAATAPPFMQYRIDPLARLRAHGRNRLEKIELISG